MKRQGFKPRGRIEGKKQKNIQRYKLLQLNEAYQQRHAVLYFNMFISFHPIFKFTPWYKTGDFPLPNQKTHKGHERGDMRRKRHNKNLKM